jgi:hypothetical protein
MDGQSKQHTQRQRPDKTCIVCGQDCSSRPRVRDEHGRYHCRECYDLLKEAKGFGERAGATGESRGGIGSAAGNDDPLAALGVDLAWDNEGKDEGGVGGGINPEVLENALVECPGCGKPEPRNTVICPACGLNWQTGKQVATEFTVEENNDRESKTPPTLRRSPSDIAREESMRSSVIREYINPLVLIGVGTFIVTGVPAMFGAEEAVVAYLIFLSILTVVGLASFFICSALWIGFEAPWHLTALRLAGIYSMSFAVLVVAVVVVPFGVIGLAIGWITYITLLMKYLDLDTADAFMVALVSVILWIVLYLVMI